jgi:hypothetical protein
VHTQGYSPDDLFEPRPLVKPSTIGYAPPKASPVANSAEKRVTKPWLTA